MITVKEIVEGLFEGRLGMVLIGVLCGLLGALLGDIREEFFGGIRGGLLAIDSGDCREIFGLLGLKSDLTFRDVC